MSARLSPVAVVRLAKDGLEANGLPATDENLIITLAEMAAIAMTKIGGGYVRAKPIAPVRPGKQAPKELS